MYTTVYYTTVFIGVLLSLVLGLWPLGLMFMAALLDPVRAFLIARCTAPVNHQPETVDVTAMPKPAPTAGTEVIVPSANSVPAIKENKSTSAVIGYVLESGEKEFQSGDGTYQSPYLLLQVQDGSTLELKGIDIPSALRQSCAVIGDKVSVERHTRYVQDPKGNKRTRKNAFLITKI